MTDDVSTALTRLSEKVSLQGESLARVETKVGLASEKMETLGDALTKAIKTEERFLAFVQQDKESKDRLWQHLENVESELATMRGFVEISKSNKKFRSGVWLALIAAVIGAGLTIATESF